MTPLRHDPQPWRHVELALSDWPHNWSQQLLDAVHYGRQVKTSGRGPGSLEDDATAGLDYTVLTGDLVARYLPWLATWYESASTLERMSELAGEPVTPSPDRVSGLNVNVLRGPGGRYEWHTDSQPYTLVLFASTLAPGAGGELQYGDMQAPHRIACRAGEGLFFDGAAVPHAVAPLTTAEYRISIPMVYLPAGAALDRAEGLDGYLFDERTS